MLAYSVGLPANNTIKDSTINGDRTSGKKIMVIDTITPPI